MVHQAPGPSPSARRCAGDPEAAAALCGSGRGHVTPAHHPGADAGLGGRPLPRGGRRGWVCACVLGIVCAEGPSPQAMMCVVEEAASSVSPSSPIFMSALPSPKCRPSQASLIPSLPPSEKLYLPAYPLLPDHIHNPPGADLHGRALWQSLCAGGRFLEQGGDVLRGGRARARRRQPAVCGGVRCGGPARPALRLGRRVPLGQHPDGPHPPKDHARARLGRRRAAPARPQLQPGARGVRRGAEARRRGPGHDAQDPGKSKTRASALAPGGVDPVVTPSQGCLGPHRSFNSKHMYMMK